MGDLLERDGTCPRCQQDRFMDPMMGSVCGCPRWVPPSERDPKPSTWLPPGASEAEPGEPNIEDDGAEPAGRWSGPDTFEPIEQAIRDVAPIGDELADARAERVRSRLFGKDGGT